MNKIEEAMYKHSEQFISIKSEKLDKNGILSMSNMGQDVKEALTGGSVAVVGKGAVDIINISKNITDKICETISTNLNITTTNGIYNVAMNGKYQDFSTLGGFGRFQSFLQNCNSYEIFKVSCKTEGNMALAIFYDENDTVISYYKKASETGTVDYVDELIEIPAKCYKVAFGTANQTTNPLKITKVEKEVFDIKTMFENFNNFEFELNLLKSKVNYIYNSEFKWLEMDKGYISIVFDDCRHDLSTVRDIFKEYNVPLCVACPTNTLVNILDDGKKCVDILKEIISNGGEVLSHSTDSGYFTEGNATNELILRKLRDSKRTLYNNGIISNGFIFPGGGGSLPNLDKFKDIVRTYYNYADLGTSREPFNHSRTWVTSGVANIKSKIDDCRTNKKWQPIFGHTIDGTESNFNEATLRAIIEYANSQGVGIVTYNYIYSNFGSF